MAKKTNGGKKNVPSLIIMGLLGLFLIFWPNASLNIAGKLAGIALLLKGKKRGKD